MKKIIFASDLDNTLIHSYKHMRKGDVCVEMLNGREQGYMSSRVYEQLGRLPQNVELIPLTTRCVSQFERIKLPEGCFRRALTTNGALLFVDGVCDEDWSSPNRKYAESFMKTFEQLKSDLENDDKLNVVRIVDDMYFYISCSDPMYVDEYMMKYGGTQDIDVMASGRKIYFLPPKINKGYALKRLAEKESDSFVIAAGDSTIDLPMLETADCAVIPKELDSLLKNPNRKVYSGDGDFAEFVADTVFETAE